MFLCKMLSLNSNVAYCLFPKKVWCIVYFNHSGAFQMVGQSSTAGGLWLTALLCIHLSLTNLCFFFFFFLFFQWTSLFQVIAGGNYDVDCFVTDPQSQPLYNEKKKQYDSFSHTTVMKGVYKVCFSNEFSTFTHKIVYLDFRHGVDDPLWEMSRTTALTQVRKNTYKLEKKKKRICKTKDIVKYRLLQRLLLHKWSSPHLETV